MLSNGDSRFLKLICKELIKPILLFGTEFEKNKVKKYSVYRIDFSKVENIKLYKDPNVRDFDSYFTMDNIRPEWIEKIDEIKL